ncbi:integrase domain-containing protein (plasmid) [Cupriavidus basilensis]
MIIIDYVAISERSGLPPSFVEDFKLLAGGHLKKIRSPSRLSDKPVSFETQYRRIINLLAAFRELREDGYRLGSPWNLKQKHIAHLVRKWVLQLKQAPGTVENKLTYLRTIAAWMGKHNLVGKLDDYIERPDDYRRTYYAETEKTWDASEVDVDALLRKIEQSDRHVAMQLKLQAAFGIRAKESFMLKPHQVTAEGKLAVVDGTKAKRRRAVKIEFEVQYDLLVSACRLANRSSGSTVPDEYTLDQWRDHYYHILRVHGVTKRELQITSHGLRHQYLNGLYHRVTGERSAIQGGTKPETELHREGMRRVVEAAGHSRATKSNAYLGVHRAPRRQRPSLEEVRGALERAGQEKKAAAAELGISRQALYRILDSERNAAASGLPVDGF